VIKRRVALLDSAEARARINRLRFGPGGDHSGKAIARFAAEIAAMEEVMECYRMAGDVDYGLRVVVPDAAAFDVFYKRLIETIPLKNVTSRFALENVKSETAFPIATRANRTRARALAFNTRAALHHQSSTESAL
jgi:Lrp/AsnC family transcriptional regulator